MGGQIVRPGFQSTDDSTVTIDLRAGAAAHLVRLFLAAQDARDLDIMCQLFATDGEYLNEPLPVALAAALPLNARVFPNRFG